MQNDLDPKGLEAARSAIRYLSSPSTPWSDEQVGAVIRAYLSAVPDGEGELVEAAAVALFRFDYPKDRWGRFGQKDYHPEKYRAKARAALAASGLSQAGVRVDAALIERFQDAYLKAGEKRHWHPTCPDAEASFEIFTAALSGDTL